MRTRRALRKMSGLKLTLFFDASQGGRVYAIPEAGWRGTIAKHMTQMRATSCALDLCPSHEEETAIRLLSYSIFLYGFPEAWPASAGIELGVRVEERVPADYALIDALLVAVPIFSC